ncbi:MAG: hypothetical protein ACYCXG_07225 [Acidiferrobacter sp.]
MMRSVMFGGFLAMMSGVGTVRMRKMRMMGRLLVLSGLMMLRCFGVMLGRFGVMFRGILMVLSAFMHNVDSLYHR